MRGTLIFFLILFSIGLLGRGYSGRTYFKQNTVKDSPTFSPYKDSHHSHQKRTMSKHTYKLLRSRLTYLKSLISSKETSIDPLTGERIYHSPDNLAYTFPGNSRLTQTKFQRSQIYKKYRLGEPSPESIQELEDSIERPYRKVTRPEVPPSADNSCEKAIETRRKFMKTNDKKDEILYFKYKTMCEEK